MAGLTPRRDRETPVHGLRPLVTTSKKDPGTVDRGSVRAVRPSTVPLGKNRGAVKDSRPIHDKPTQAQWIRNILDFVSQNGFEGDLREKDLRSPTRNNFYDLMGFLLQLLYQVKPIDPKKAATEEEALKVFRQFRYPYVLNKSFLTAIGAPGTWPQLLAALHWLVRVIEAAQSMDCTLLHRTEPGAEEDDDRPSALPRESSLAAGTPRRASLRPGYAPTTPGRDALAPAASDRRAQAQIGGRDLFHRYCTLTYDRFMNGEDDPYPEEDQMVRTAVHEATQDVARELQELQHSVHLAAERVTSLESGRDVDLQVLDRGEQMRVQVAKYEAFIGSQDNKINELAENVNSLEATHSQMEEEITRLEAEAEMIEAKVDSQEWTAGQIAQLRAEHASLERSLAGAQDEKVRLDAEHAASAEKAVAAKEEVSAALRRLRARALPAGDAQRCLDRLRLADDGTDERSLLGQDLRDVNLVLRSNADDLTTAAEEFTQQTIAGQDKVARLEAEQRELQDQLDRCEAKQRQVVSLHEHQVSLQKSKWDAAAGEVATLEKENAGGNSDLEAFGKQVRALQEKQQALELGQRTKRLRLADERAAAEARLDAAGREALAQKAAVLQKLREVREACRARVVA